MMRPVKRRRFVEGALAGLGAAAVATACKGSSQAKKGGSEGAAVVTGKKVRWRLASSFPRGLDTLFGASEVLAKRVKALSGGQFEIKVHAAGEIVPALEVLDAVQQKSVDVAHTASYYFTGKNPALAFDTCVPFGMTARQHDAWLMKGGGLEKIRKLYADFKVLNFPGGQTGVQMGGWFKKEIASVEDLKGLKIRIPGLGGQVMSKLGATVQVLAGGDIFPALERGAIDATEWVGPYDDEKLGFHKVAKLYYYPGWWEPGPALTFLVNQKAWDSLPAAYKEIFELAAVEASRDMVVSYDQKNPEALARLVKGGVQLKPFTDDVMEAAEKASTELLNELAAKDAGTKAIYEHWNAARKSMASWFGTAELAYMKFAFR